MGALGAIADLLGAHRAVLVTPLSPQQCADRLRDRVDHGLKPFGSKPVVGHVGDGSIALRKRIGYRNSFQTVLKARLEADAVGTRLRCRTGMSVFAAAFMVFWLGVVTMIGAGLAGAILSGRADAAAGVFVLGPAVMILFGIGLLLVGRLVARSEGPFLVDFLCRELDARRQAAPPDRDPIVR